MKLKSLLTKTAQILLFLGFEHRRTLSLRNLPEFFSHRKLFARNGGKITHNYPILTDFSNSAGTAKGHYFHQDLLVANFINKSNPTRHIDIGSRIDGFVAHVAAFRKIETVDIRPLHNTAHSNIKFLQKDVMKDDDSEPEITDSISCLHAIEHFGLGRYGDPIDPKGHIQGFNNILKMLKVGGTLYISFPIGIANEVHFNAHRVFKADDIFSWTDDSVGLELLRFDYVDDGGDLLLNVPIESALSNISYGCGIYTLKKLSHQ